MQKQTNKKGYSRQRGNCIYKPWKQIYLACYRKVNCTRGIDYLGNTVRSEARYYISKWSLLKIFEPRVPNVAQRVKDPALLQLWHRSQLQLGFHTWPRNFHMPCMWPKKRKKEMQIWRCLLSLPFRDWTLLTAQNIFVQMFFSVFVWFFLLLLLF